MTALSETGTKSGSRTRFDAAANRYELALDGGTAFADVREIDGKMIFFHTEVPHSLRGHGIGGRLIKAALDDVRQKGRKVVPRCWFVAQFIEQNPSYRDLLATTA